MMDVTKKWIERSINAVSTFVDGCHQAGDSASVEYLRGNLTLGDLRGLLAAVESAPPEGGQQRVVPLALMEIRECFHFWQHYASLNEGEQDDMNEQRMMWLAKMQGWCYFVESPQLEKP